MEFKLIATTGRARGQSVEIRAAKFFIGRHDNCQLQPDIPGLAGIHALIEERDNRLYLRDFGAEGGPGSMTGSSTPARWRSSTAT